MCTGSHEEASKYSPNAVYLIILVQVHRKLTLIIMGRKQFIPLESNPEVMTDFMQNLGADTRQFKFTDVWGLDPVRCAGGRVDSLLQEGGMGTRPVDTPRRLPRRTSWP